MNIKTILLGVFITGLTISGSVQARESLTSIGERIDQLIEGQAQLSAGQQAILDDLARLRAELGITLPNCEELEYTGTVWGREAKGVDLRRFTNSTLHFIGCVGDGCPADTFFCDFDKATLTLSFGTTSGDALRALVDPGNANGDAIPASSIGCSSPSNPDSISNAPDQIADARALCRALGFNDGTVEAVNANTCPKPTALDGDGQTWGNNYVFASGYGRSFTCTGIR